MASIVSGKPITLSGHGNLQGIAPGADIVAVQVFSYDAARKAQPVAILGDLLKALQFVINNTSASTTNNPWTVNMSLGGGKFTDTCYPTNTVWFQGDTVTPIYLAFTNAVQSMKARGVPVIAATGNDGYTHGIAWPACAQGVVKVSALVNDTAGMTLSKFQGTAGGNLVSPTYFPNETFWLAPGGGAATNALAATNPTYVWGAAFSTTAQTTLFGGFAGTSQATPHVSGIYADVKGAVPGVTVDVIYQTLVNLGAVLNGPSFLDDDCAGRMGPSQFPCGLHAVTYKKIRLP